MIYFVRRPAPEPADGSAGPHQAGPDTNGPSAGLFLTEPVRGLVDLAALLVAAPWLATAPRGDGHGVLVLPGLLASDTSTLPLRGYLRWLGYDVHGWDLGRNRGPTEEVLAGLLENLANKEVADRLHISERTVKFHVSNLLAKFGVRRRADLILLCYQRRSAGT